MQFTNILTRDSINFERVRIFVWHICAAASASLRAAEGQPDAEDGPHAEGFVAEEDDTEVDVVAVEADEIVGAAEDVETEVVLDAEEVEGVDEVVAVDEVVTVVVAAEDVAADEDALVTAGVGEAFTLLSAAVGDSKRGAEGDSGPHGAMLSLVGVRGPADTVGKSVALVTY